MIINVSARSFPIVGAKIITAEDETRINDRTIKTCIPIFMYDALGTTVGVRTIINPLESLESAEEAAIYTLISLREFNPQNEGILKQTIHSLQMDDFAEELKRSLQNKGLAPKFVFYQLIDIVTEEYCKKIGDTNQELRQIVLLKTHFLVYPGIFNYVNEYSQTTFKSEISQLILTQDNPIMKKVYEKMLKRQGYNDVKVITVPNEKFAGLFKDDSELYKKLAFLFNKETNEMGLYDDLDKNIIAAKNAGVLTQLATRIENKKQITIEKEASSLVRLLFGESERNERF